MNSSKTANKYFLLAPFPQRKWPILFSSRGFAALENVCMRPWALPNIMSSCTSLFICEFFLKRQITLLLVVLVACLGILTNLQFLRLCNSRSHVYAYAGYTYKVGTNFAQNLIWQFISNFIKYHLGSIHTGRYHIQYPQIIHGRQWEFVWIYSIWIWDIWHGIQDKVCG